MRLRTALLFLLLFLGGTLYAQADANRIRNRLSDYFTQYTNAAYSSADPIRLTNVMVDTQQRVVTLEANAGFASQPFTRETVARIHHDVEQLMPPPFNTYQIRILANGTPIEELMPLEQSDTVASLRRWGDISHRGNAWVTPLSLPVTPTKGLQGRHLAVWASHGRYYDFSKAAWQWQRPRLYCTTEDIFTQSFVTPFLIPMLEQAGAYVFTPRERDWQREEVIVDNNIDTSDGLYTETNGTYEWTDAGLGFSPTQDVYFDQENPFLAGTSRKAEAQPRKRLASQIVWQPRLPREGRYAVYISYTTLPTSVSDAEYTVRHKGISTRFRVNQQMGGSTWVYLGTFDFDAGSSADNCVLLTNQSNYRGVVTADAVRFGGGMGNVARGDSLHAKVRSGLPRFLEGSRYYAQWAGMPYSVYGNKEGTSDYAEDINVRSLMANHLARGSAYLPGDSGLCVPLELTLAVHSDAGFRPDSSHIGTLGIYTTGNHTQTSDLFTGPLAEGMLPSLRSRLMSRDLCDRIMTQVDEDIRRAYGTWNRRQMHDRNYSETRVPELPAIILETLSHQNWADLLRGHDPALKILLSRAIYKGILRYIASVHSEERLVVQPQTIRSFAASLTNDGDSTILSWHAQTEASEPSSMPVGYIIYTSEGNRGYDNGQVVYGTQARLPIRRGELTRYQVRAFNEGGLSLPSEELCVYAAPHERHRLLIVNGFTRLAGPQPVSNDSLRGFDFNIDPGVVYHHSPSYCGRQVNMRRGLGEDFGQSGDELEGMLVAGNTFDFPTLHARDFLLADTTLSVASCSCEAFEQGGVMGGFHAIDLILGAQRQDGYSLEARPAFSPEMYEAITHFTRNHASILLSGAYIGEEIAPEFASQTLHFLPDGSCALNDSTNVLTGMNTQFSLYCQPNEERYSLRRISSILPTPGAFTSVTSPLPLRSLAVAYQGPGYRTLTYGFPLECIRETEIRKAVMAASLSFLLNP
ncbi:MAG: hypothetical protein IJ197_02185 [Bacteroidaceae bacterium]|nr:hypothetical protein [Bacteroidaceae bacterium]